MPTTSALTSSMVRGDRIFNRVRDSLRDPIHITTPLSLCPSFGQIGDHVPVIRLQYKTQLIRVNYLALGNSLKGRLQADRAQIATSTFGQREADHKARGFDQFWDILLDQLRL